MKNKSISDFLSELEKYKLSDMKIYIFGAGKCGRILSEFFFENNIEFTSYCVTNKAENEKFVCGHSVIQFNELEFDPCKSLFINAVLERGYKTIETQLRASGVINYLEIPQEIYYSDSEEKCYKENPTMEITAHIGCSVNCKYCPQNLLLKNYFKNNQNRPKEMTFSQYKEILSKLPKNTLIEWSGFVEPFLNPSASDMMVYTHEQGFKQTLYTTLVGMNDDDLEKIKNISFKTVCLHTPDENNYANIPMSGHYMHLLDKIINLKRIDGTPFITTANCQSSPHPDILKITAGKLKIYTELSDRAGEIEDEKIAHYHKDGKIWCARSVNLNHNVLLPDGSVVLCCNDFGMRHILGNLFKQSYEEINNGKVKQQIKRNLLLVDSDIDTLICRKCIFAVKCN